MPTGKASGTENPPLTREGVPMMNPWVRLTSSTVPVGVPLAGGFAATVITMVTGWPNGAGLGVAVAVVVVVAVAFVAIRFRVVLLGVKKLSPP